MTCKNCGQDIPDNSIFCLYCGAPTKDGVIPAHKKNEGNVLVRMFWHLYANSGCLSFTLSIVILLYLLFVIFGFTSFMMMDIGKH